MSISDIRCRALRFLSTYARTIGELSFLWNNNYANVALWMLKQWIVHLMHFMTPVNERRTSKSTMCVDESAKHGFCCTGISPKSTSFTCEWELSRFWVPWGEGAFGRRVNQIPGILFYLYFKSQSSRRSYCKKTTLCLTPILISHAFRYVYTIFIWFPTAVLFISDSYDKSAALQIELWRRFDGENCMN